MDIRLTRFPRSVSGRAVILLSGPLHTFMVLNLLHTFLPALDSRFSDTANNLSVVLGQGEVSQRDLDSKTDALSEVFTTAPRWKRCALETQRGFGGVLAHLLGENVAGGEVRRRGADGWSS